MALVAQCRYRGSSANGQRNSGRTFAASVLRTGVLLDLQHVTRLQPTTRLLVDAAHASDDQYFEDFGVGFEGTSITYLNRLAEARHDTTNWSLVARVQDYQILDPDLTDAEQPYSILPQVAAIGRWRKDFGQS